MKHVRLKIFYHAFKLFSRSRHFRRQRLTKSGLLVAFMLFVSAVVGIDTNRNLTHQIFTFLCAISLVAVLSALFFRTRFSIKRMLPRFCTVGEKLTYKISVRNNSAKRQQGLTLIENPEFRYPDFKEFISRPEPGEEKRHAFDRFMKFRRWQWLMRTKQTAIVDRETLPVIMPGDNCRVNIELTPLKRGVLRLPTVTVARADPFGLFRAFYKATTPQTLLVLPKRYHLPPFDLPGNRTHQPSGTNLATSVGDSQEFAAMRDYRPGDPLRSIHWKSWAKIGKPVVKEFQEEYFVRHALILDTFGTGGPEFEEAVSLAASFAGTIRTQESLLDLLFIGPESYCFTSGRGLGHTEQMLEILASVAPCADKEFPELTSMVLNRVHLLSGCICIFIDWDEERQNLVRLLRGMNVPALTFIISESLDDSLETQDVHQLHPDHIEEGLAKL